MPIGKKRVAIAAVKIRRKYEYLKSKIRSSGEDGHTNSRDLRIITIIAHDVMGAYSSLPLLADGV